MNTNDSDAIAIHNQESLHTLQRTLKLSVGRFTLIFVRCDYLTLRDQIVSQVQAQSALEIQQVTLSQGADTVFTAIKATLGDHQPDALMVFGLETVQNLAQVLKTTNLVREEFRKNFACPILIWVHSGIQQQLIRHAPDLENWATSLVFNITNAELLNLLQQRVDRVFEQVLSCRENRFLDAQALDLRPDSLQGWEFQAACRAVQERGLALPEALVANLAFVQGLIADNSTTAAREHYERSLTLWEPLEASEQQGYVQFYLGLWWGNCAARHLPEREDALTQAVQHLEAAQNTFEQNQRPDLAAKFITYQAAALHRQANWPALERLIPHALTLLKQHPDPFRQSRIRGFQAELALAQSCWADAQTQAQHALRLMTAGITALGTDLNPTDTALLRWVEAYHQGWYLYSLGRAQRQLADVTAAQRTLHQAKDVTQPQYDPDLYIGILQTLRELHFEQGDYLQAFELKQKRKTIESQFGYSAFIGAGRLQAKQRITNPALPGVARATVVAQEIAASGRQQDVERLIARMGRDDHKLTVVYGQSGVGKSSMLQAGFIPALAPQTIEARMVAIALQQVYTDWVVALGRHLWESLQQHPPSLQLPAAPTTVAEILAHIRRVTEQNLWMVLVFDQFEEFFFEFKDTTQRKPFYEFLKHCLDIPYVKVVLSLREDYLNSLLECNRLENLAAIDNNILDKSILFYVGNFTRSDAQAVIEQLTAATAFQLEPALSAVLVEDLAADFGEVRPIELQVVGAQLQAENLRTLAAYQEQGPKERLVERFLEDVIADCGMGNEQLTRLVLYLLTDENNTRPLRTRSDLELELDLEAGKLELILAVLVKSRLVFQIPSSPEARFQLVHDYLVAFVRQQRSAETTRLIAEIEQEREKRRITEAQLERALKERERALVWRLGLGAVVVVLALFLPYVWTVQNNLYLQGLTIASRQLLGSGNDLLALEYALKAGKRINRWWSIGVRPETRVEVTTRLQDVVYGSRLINTLEGHEDSVTAVKFSADSKYIISGSEDNTVKVWTREGENIKTLFGATDSITCVSISKENKFILAGSEDETVRVWDFKGDLLHTFEQYNSAIKSIAISPDEKIVVSGEEVGKLFIQNLSSGKKIELNQGFSEVNKIIFIQDGSKFISTTVDGDITLWDIRGNKLSNFKQTEELVNVYTRGKHIFVFDKLHLTVWTMEGKLVRRSRYNSYLPNLVASELESGLTAVVNFEDIYIKNLDLYSHFKRDDYWESLYGLHGHKGAVIGIDINPEGNLLVSSSEDRTIRIWNIQQNFSLDNPRTIEEVKVIDSQRVLTQNSFNNPYSLDNVKTVSLWNILSGDHQEVSGKVFEFEPLSNGFITAGKNNLSYLLDIRGELKRGFSGGWSGVFSKESHDLVATIQEISGRKYVVNIFDQNTGKIVTQLGKYDDPIYALEFSSNGRILAVALEEDVVEIWDLETGKLASLDIDGSKILQWVFDPEGLFLTIYRSDQKIEVYSISGHLVNELDHKKSEFFFAHIDHVKKRIAVVGQDNDTSRIEIYDSLLNGVKILGSYEKGEVYNVTFSGDGQTLIASLRGKTQFFDLSSERLISTIEESYREISSDGRFILTVDDDSTAKVRHQNGDLVGRINLKTPRQYRDYLKFKFSENSNFLIVNQPFHKEIQIYDMEGELSFAIQYSELVKNNDLFDQKDWFEILLFDVYSVPGSDYLAIRTHENEINIWSLFSKSFVGNYHGRWDFIDDFRITNDHESILVSAGKYKVDILNLEQKNIKSLLEGSENINELSINSGENLLGIATDDKEAKILRIGDDVHSENLRGHEDSVMDIEFSPLNEIVATASKDETIKIWSISGELINSYDAIHTDKVNSVAFSPDGNLLVSSSDDKSAVLISLETGKNLALSHDFKVVNAAFSPDGKLIYTATSTSIKIWDLDGNLLSTYQRLGNTDFDFIDEDPTDSEYSLVTAGGIEPKIIEFDLQTLLTKGCQTAKNYLKHNKSVKDSDRKICDQFIDDPEK